MNKETIEQIKFWIIERRSNFTKLMEKDPHRENIPLYLRLPSIDINIFTEYINDEIFLINDKPLYLNYTNLFPIMSIQLTDSYQYKLFFMFYKLSLFHCPTHAEWEVFRSDVKNITALMKESIEKTDTILPAFYYPI